MHMHIFLHTQQRRAQLWRQMSSTYLGSVSLWAWTYPASAKINKSPSSLCWSDESKSVRCVTHWDLLRVHELQAEIVRLHQVNVIHNLVKEVLTFAFTLERKSENGSLFSFQPFSSATFLPWALNPFHHANGWQTCRLLTTIKGKISRSARRDALRCISNR